MSLTNSSFININGNIKACGNNAHGQLGLNDISQ